MVGMNEPTTRHYLRPALVTAVASSLFGLAVCAVLAVIGWAISPSGSFWTPVRQGAQGWLVAHGSGLQRDGIHIDAVPLGATLALVLFIAWVTIKTVVDPVADVVPFVAATAAVYALLAGLVSVLAQSDQTGTSLWRSVVGAALICAVGCLLGIGYAHGDVKTMWSRQDAQIRAVVRGATVGAATLMLAATVLYAVLLVQHLDRAGELWSGLKPGFFGGIGLALVCLATLPNLVLWTTSALIGPGFILGTGTSVDLTGAHLGAVPALPTLAALPTPGSFAGWVFTLMLVPILAGVAAGWYACRGMSDEALTGHVAYGALSGAAAGLAVGLLIVISGGAIGPGRMADVGPPLLTPLVTAVFVLGLGGAVGAALGHYRGARAEATSRK